MLWCRKSRLEQLQSEVRENTQLLREILARLPKPPTQIHSAFEGATMPVTLNVGQTVIQTITESNASGNVPVVPANLTNTSSDSTIASVVDNNDGTFTWTAVAPGTVTSTFADTVFNLSGADTLTIVGPTPPTAIASSFGSPQ